MKLLFGSLTWCLEGQDARAEQQLHYLSLTSKVVKENNCQWIIVDNASTHPKIKQALNEYEAESVIINPCNYGWAVGRNQMMQKYEESTADILVMQDCDIFLEDLRWPERLLNAFDKISWLHVCQVRSTDTGEQGRGDFLSLRLVEGVFCNQHERFIGATNAIDRRALALLGGYDWKSIPTKWGFHDPEYGVRLEALNVHLQGPHLDPVRVKSGFHDPERLGMDGNPQRPFYAAKAAPYFDAQIAKVRANKVPLYFDYHLMPKEGDLI